MRVDDRLNTALLNSDKAERTDARGQWRQLIDLLAQNPVGQAPDRIAAGLMRVRQMRDSVALDHRVSAVAALHGRILSAPLVQLLAGDAPAVAAAAIAGARLSDDDWADMVPHLPVRARGFLRNRRDLGAATQRALALYAGGDFVLPVPPSQGLVDVAQTPPPPATAAQGKAVPVAEVIERLERWRRDHDNELTRTDTPQLPFAPGAAGAAAPATEIRFETDDNGTVIWIEGAPRGSVVGVDIARPAFDNGPGPDAYGAAAFRQRMPMENARMRLRGASVVEGDWRMSASPFFDATSGRFRGFRGIMRRPMVSETADIAPDPVKQAEQLQQILHELRTPLGAIVGFAEIIDHQMFGPVDDSYRALATDILTDANQLLSGFDDLALAAQLNRGALPDMAGTTDCAWLTERLAARLQTVSDSLDVEVNLSVADPVRPFAMAQDMAERLFSRLLAAVIMGCKPKEVLRGRFSTELGSITSNRFVLTLPSKLVGQGEDILLASEPVGGYSPGGSPLLGLGFSLRLVRNLARNVGGSLQFQNEKLLVTIPAAQDDRHLSRDQRGD